MKKSLVAVIILSAILNIITVSSYSSDYQGKDKDDSVFQKLGDLITGKYEVEGVPIKNKGVIQAVADQVKDIEPAPVR